LRLGIKALLKTFWGVYLLLTSLYCLLAFLPYTYYFLIKAPAYAWMPWFAQHHALLYWFALGVAAVGYWPGKKTTSHTGIYLALILPGLYLLARPLLPLLQSNRSAYIASLLALMTLILTAAAGAREYWIRLDSKSSGCFRYSTAVLTAVLVAVLYSGGTALSAYLETGSLVFHLQEVELSAWSVLSHVLVAVLIFSALNLITLLSGKTRYSGQVRTGLIAGLCFAFLWMGLERFMTNFLSFEGWMAQLYAASLAAAMAIFAGSIVLPFLVPQDRLSTESLRQHSRAGAMVIAALTAAGAVALPSLIRGGDWNGVLQGTCTLIFWLVLSVCLYRLRPHAKRYSVAAILAVLLVSAFAYKGLQASEVIWARPLGDTDDAISRRMEAYASQNASFQLVHELLGNSRGERCGDLCRILREYTDIRNASAIEVPLVNSLTPGKRYRPNIFLFVIDSLRPDYLGAYNPRVDFTPNLDALARDSVALHNVYTQYAGTSLSEPAIWAGAMLLHAHYQQPFLKMNNLEKLAQADDYQLIVSWDEVLRQILSPADGAIKLDTDKPLWNQLEACSTIRQAESVLDRRDPARPVLFYAQPKNVHQFAHNDLPRATKANWIYRPGFNNRVAYEVHQVDGCIGGFVSYLKARGMYDDSVIIITSDHGDATGELGRSSHSTIIYPEIIRVPLIVHLPAKWQQGFVCDDHRVSALTDITPSLYYLLGHRPIRHDPMLGHPLFTTTRQELESYSHPDLFLASDVRAAYGILDDNGRFLYVTYDSPPESYLFDLGGDPDGLHNVLTPQLKQQYDERIIQYLQQVGNYYDYRPGMGSLLASAKH